LCRTQAGHDFSGLMDEIEVLRDLLARTVEHYHAAGGLGEALAGHPTHWMTSVWGAAPVRYYHSNHSRAIGSYRSRTRRARVGGSAHGPG
jgi:hypothetical protein